MKYQTGSRPLSPLHSGSVFFAAGSPKIFRVNSPTFSYETPYFFIKYSVRTAILLSSSDAARKNRFASSPARSSPDHATASKTSQSWNDPPSRLQGLSTLPDHTDLFFSIMMPTSSCDSRSTPRAKVSPSRCPAGRAYDSG